MNSNPHYGLQCPKCEDIIFSEYTHDFKSCKCGAIFVDGGTDYLRYGYTNDIKKEDIKMIPKSKGKKK